MKALSYVVVLAFLLCFVGCAPQHEWVAATCTEPKTCSKCGETEGEPLGHDWVDATCTKPKTCRRCGKTEGAVLAHSWQAATNVSPRRCKMCGLAEGSCPLDGTWLYDLGFNHRFYRYVIDTANNRCDVYEIGTEKGDQFCELLNRDYSLHSYSGDTVRAGQNTIIKYIDNNTIHIIDDRDPDDYWVATFVSKELDRSVWDNEKTEPVNAKEKNNARHTDAEAFTVACEIVKASLKAPSSAKFCKVTEAEIEHVGNGRYWVKGWVEAQNSFGAVIRQSFQVTYSAIKKGNDIGYKDAKCSIY